MLTERSIRYIIRELKKDRGTRVLAEEMNVSQRRIQQLWAEYQRTGKAHTQGRAGRPREADPSDAEIEMALDIHRRWPDGVQLTVRRLRKSGFPPQGRVVSQVCLHDLKQSIGSWQAWNARNPGNPGKAGHRSSA